MAIITPVPLPGLLEGKQSAAYYRQDRRSNSLKLPACLQLLPHVSWSEEYRNIYIFHTTQMKDYVLFTIAILLFNFWFDGSTIFF